MKLFVELAMTLELLVILSLCVVELSLYVLYLGAVVGVMGEW